MEDIDNVVRTQPDPMDIRPRGIMKKRSQHTHAQGRKEAKASGPTTGESPATGWWAPADKGASTQFLTEGTLMPLINGEVTSWALVSVQYQSTEVSTIAQRKEFR